MQSHSQSGVEILIQRVSDIQTVLLELFLLVTPFYLELKFKAGIVSLIHDNSIMDCMSVGIHLSFFRAAYPKIDPGDQPA